MRYKTFSSYDSLDKENKLIFFQFKKFNEFLESNRIDNYNLIYNAYIKILESTGDDNIDYSGYSELDYQVKFLIEDVKVGLSDILNFADLKFTEIEDKIMLSLDIFPFIPIQEKTNIINEMIATKKGKLHFIFENKQRTDSLNYYIRFDLSSDILKNFTEFEKGLKSIDFTNFGIKYKNINSYLLVIKD